MPQYRYRALTSAGTIVTSRMDEANEQIVKTKLKRNDLTPIYVKKVGKSRKKKATKRNVSELNEVLRSVNTANIAKSREENNLNIFQRAKRLVNRTERITNRDIIVFTQNFYLLKKANFNNIHALSTIIENTENFELQEILRDILAGVEAGENIYTTMEYYSDVFPYLYINMIKVGEQSGSLMQSLEQAVKYLEDSDNLNKKIRSILAPNIAMFIGLVIMLFVGTLVAIPAIQNVFDSLGSTEKLPGITLWFAGVVDNLIKYWYIPLPIIAGIVGIILWYINTPKGKYDFHYFKYTMPIFGKLIYALDFSRFIRAMALNLENGMRIQDAIEVSKSVCKNLVMLSIIEASINNLLIGRSWLEPFEKAHFGNSMTTEMLKIGMQTDLTEMMQKLLIYMEADIDNILKKIVKVLPEVTYAIVGVVLIFFVLVVLVPCIQVYMGGFLFSAYGF